MDIQSLKLISGEEIFAEVIKEDENGVTISNPIRIAYMPSEDGSSQMAVMLDWLHSTKKELVLTHNLIMCRGPAIREVVSTYGQKYGSGLVVPDTGGNLIV